MEVANYEDESGGHGSKDRPRVVQAATVTKEGKIDNPSNQFQSVRTALPNSYISPGRSTTRLTSRMSAYVHFACVASTTRLKEI